MKSYEDLTKLQKEKLNTYLICRNNSITLISPFLIGAMAFYAIGLPFLITSLWYVALAPMFISMLLFLLVIGRLTTTNKYLYLAFNMEDSMEDMFDIKKTDIMNLRRRWKKYKE